MKALQISFLLITLISAPLAHSQDNPTGAPVKTTTAPKAKTSDPTPTKVISTTSVEIQLGTKNTQRLKKLDAYTDGIPLKNAELMKQKSEATDPCAKAELQAQINANNFATDHKDQIQSVYNKIQKGLKTQYVLLNGYLEGTVEDYTKETYTNSEGQQDQSVILTINMPVGTTKDTREVKVPVKELMKYVMKYQEDANKIADNDDSAIQNLIKRYSETKYFNMTLSEAKRAYELLGTMFARTTVQEAQRKMVIGDGKNYFRIITVTTTGYQPECDCTISTQQNVGALDPTGVALNQVLNFDKAFEQSSEDASYWKIVSDQEITIEGVPIDGRLRTIYFDRRLPVDCAGKWVFPKTETPGPSYDYSAKTPCQDKGIHITSASLTVTALYGGGGTAKVGDVFQVTSDLAAMADGQSTYKSDYIGKIFPESRLGRCDYVMISGYYTCGCKPVPTPFNAHYKADQTFSISCQ